MANVEPCSATYMQPVQQKHYKIEKETTATSNQTNYGLPNNAHNGSTKSSKH